MQPAALPQPDAVAVITSNAVHILRVLEGFLRTAASPAICASRRPGLLSFESNLVSAFLEVTGAAWGLTTMQSSSSTAHAHGVQQSACKTAVPCLLELACRAGPGSPEHRQLYSLLTTVVMLQSGPNAPELLQDPGRCLVVAAQAAAHLLKPSMPGRATPAGRGGNSGQTPAAVQLLPSLVICGRCFVLYGLQLEWSHR